MSKKDEAAPKTMKEQFIELFRQCDPNTQQLINSWVMNNLGGPPYAILSMPNKSEELIAQIKLFMVELVKAVEDTKDFSFFQDGATVAEGQAGVEEEEEEEVVPNVDRGVPLRPSGPATVVEETIGETETEPEGEWLEQPKEQVVEEPSIPELDPMAVMAKALAPHLSKLLGSGTSNKSITDIVDKHLTNGGFPAAQVEKLVAERMRATQIGIVKSILGAFPSELVHDAIEQFTDEE